MKWKNVLKPKRVTWQRLARRRFANLFDAALRLSLRGVDLTKCKRERMLVRAVNK